MAVPDNTPRVLCTRGVFSGMYRAYKLPLEVVASDRDLICSLVATGGPAPGLPHDLSKSLWLGGAIEGLVVQI